MSKTYDDRRVYEKHWSDKMGQSHRYAAHFQVYGETFKVEIRRNAYDGQSYVNGFVLDGRAWNKLIYEPITEHPNVAAISYVTEINDKGLAAMREAANKIVHSLSVLMGKTAV